MDERQEPSKTVEQLIANAHSSFHLAILSEEEIFGPEVKGEAEKVQSADKSAGTSQFSARVKNPAESEPGD